MNSIKKIINDPIYGFITVPSSLVQEVIEHPYFQRLRRIKQLGLTELVYPGATHTRLHHGLGAMFLMSQALDVLQNKGTLIMEIEREAAHIAILLHDIGHGPFSHVLETCLLTDTHHEEVTLVLLEKLNEEFNGKLSLALAMFKNDYHRGFFHQLISSQLDVDRLDYLNRDSFYTGVVEGQIGAERIIKMINVIDNELVIEEKGLLSLENYLNARKLMYWQVYLHKTALSAENMLQHLFMLLKDALNNAIDLDISPSLKYFLKNKINANNLREDKNALHNFIVLDDSDIWFSIKNLVNAPVDNISALANGLLNRNLFKIILEENLDISLEKSELVEKHKLKINKKVSLLLTGSISHSGYNPKEDNIKILMKNNTILDFSQKTESSNLAALSNIIKKNYICYSHR